MHWISTNFWSGRRVLVTGASGFIGAWVVDHLSHVGAEVHAVGHTRLPNTGHVRSVTALPGDAAALVSRTKADTIFHLAAPIILEDDASAESELSIGVVDATTALIAAVDQTPARLVCVGTCAEYGGAPAPYTEDSTPEPRSAYGRAKLAATAAALSAGHTVVRPFRALGPGDTRSVVAAAAQAACSGQPFAMTTGTQVREWNHVSAIAKGIIAAGAHDGAAGQVINLGGGASESVRAVVEQVFAHAGADPSSILIGARDQRPGEVPLLAGHHGRAAALWGTITQPSLSETLAESVHWTRRQMGGAA